MGTSHGEICWLLTALPCQYHLIIKVAFLSWAPFPNPSRNEKNCLLTLVVVLELVKTPHILPLKSSSSLWGRKRSWNSSLCILWCFQIIPGILNSSNKLIRLSLVWENCTTAGEHCLHWNFSFPMLTSVLWHKNTFSTLFCASFCNGSSEWGGLCLAGLTSLVTSHRGHTASSFLSLLIQVTQASLGENFSCAPLGK